MSQYQIGTVEVTNGSTLVTAVDPSPGNANPADDVLSETTWLADVSAGDFFYVNVDSVAYVVASVTGDKTLNLTSDYQGATVAAAGTPLLAGAYYAIQRDFSTNYGMPLANKGDRGVPVFLQLAMVIMDTEMAALDARVTALEP